MIYVHVFNGLLCLHFCYNMVKIDMKKHGMNNNPTLVKTIAVIFIIVLTIIISYIAQTFTNFIYGV